MSFAEFYGKVVAEAREAERRWIEELRAKGIKAAVRDDGWIERFNGILQFVNPIFFDGADVSDLVAIGEPDRFRVVRLSWANQNRFGITIFGFEEEV